MARPGTRWTSIGSGRARSSSTDRVNASGSTMASRPASSKYARWLIWSRTAQPSAGVARSHRGSESDNSATTARTMSYSASRSSSRSGRVVMLRGYGSRRASWVVVDSVIPRLEPHPLARQDLHPGRRPHEAFHRIEDRLDQARRPRDGGKTELTPLPLVLTADLGGGHLEPGPCAVDEMAHDRTFLLERVAGGDPEVDGEGTGVEHDHHTARQAQGALARAPEGFRCQARRSPSRSGQA